MPAALAAHGKPSAAPSSSARDNLGKYELSSRMDERSGVLEVLRTDGGGRPGGKGAHRAGRVVAGVLRKRGGAHHEQIGHVPALQIAVERAVARGVAHDGAAVEMRGLIGRDVVRRLARTLDDLLRAHCFEDVRKLVGEEGA